MSMWAAIFGIVAISCIAGVFSSYFKSRGEKLGDEQRQALESRIEKAEKSANELEERVRTLESIVTDGRYELKKEFERLER